MKRQQAMYMTNRKPHTGIRGTVTGSCLAILLTAAVSGTFAADTSNTLGISETAPPPSAAGTTGNKGAPALKDSSSPVQQQGQKADTAAGELPPLEKQPELIKFVKAAYPPVLSKQGVAGTVVLDIVVNDSGKVDSVAVVKGVHPLLDSLVTAAVRQFIFSPAQAEGKPVPVIITYDYHVTLDDAVFDVKEYVNFSGKVVERGTRNPVKDAEVVLTFSDTLSDTAIKVPFSVYLKKIARFEGQELEGNGLVTTTDSTGAFSFKSIPTGVATVHIPAVGYEDFTEREKITPGELTEVTYRIQRVSYTDYEIVVYGKTERKEVAKRTLTIEEVNRIPGFGGDAVKVIQAFPGVARPAFGSGAIVVRGAPSWDSRFYLDGVPIPLLYHFGSIKSTYNSNALSSIDFYPGGFGTKYGGAIAGIIEIKGRSAKTDRWYGYGDMNLTDASGMIEGPAAKGVSVLATARRSYIGDLLGYALKHNNLFSFPISVSPFYWDYVVRTDVTRFNDHTGFLTLFGVEDGVELAVPGMRVNNPEIDNVAGRVKNRTTFNMGIAGWDWSIAKKLRNELRYSLMYGLGENSIFGFMKWDFSTWENFLRDQFSYQLSNSLLLRAGTEIDLAPYQMTAIFPQNDGTFIHDTLEETFGVAALYLNAEWSPVPKLKIMPGLRYDYFMELNYDGSVLPEYWSYASFDNQRGISGEPSLRLTTRYELAPGKVLKAAVGNYSQTPQPQGFITHKEYGNPKIGATKASHIVLGYEWQIADLLSADIQGYYNYQFAIPRFADSIDFQNAPAGTSVPTMIGDEEGRMRGLELLLRYDRGKRFFGWLSYSLSRSERRNPHDGKWVLYGQDQTNNVQLIGSARLGRNWEAGARMRYVTGNPRTPVIGSSHNMYDFYYSTEYGPVNSARVGPFFQVDVRMDKKFVFDKWMMSMYLDFQNLSYFVYKSPEFMISAYDPWDVKKKSEVVQPIASPPIPSFGLKVEF